MSKSRTPLQVSPEFISKLKNIKGQYLLKGMDKSLRELTEIIAKSGILDNLEMEINKDELMIKMDSRKRRFL